MSASTPSTEAEPQPTATAVAVGLIQRSDGRVLLAERPPHRPHGGCWEFPGGKVENGEDVSAALVRELREELGIEVVAARPWRSIPWSYPSGAVRLEVWRVDDWRGEAVGLEGQRIAWEPVGRLGDLAFPAANRGIVNALRLPERLLVTPEPPAAEAMAASQDWLARLDAALAGGILLLQFRARARAADPCAWRALGLEVVRRAHAAGALVMANAGPDEARAIGADGVHLTAARLAALEERPAGWGWVSAACHDETELARARERGVDFVLLGPVAATATHPGAAGLGWTRARALVHQCALPTYLVGGLGPDDLDAAAETGAQGIAAIRAFWNAGH